ncbi:hypothetical protein GGR54DRAFT_652334 [Hypoxylon sp. NC1633]|nr:hypothetical protein GGR54DRAFT_652334 [Hypoxylon sp. NC1633]
MEQFPQQLKQLSGDMPYPNPGTLSDIHLNTYAYCFDRGNGQYTRLIPADMLPPLKNIPALQQDCSRMIVLPLPQALPPSTTETADSRSRIDTIVAATSPTASARRPRHRDADADTNASQSQRRHKIYCDKWVHEGVCAFTQQGCKYKHEMPFDKWT